MRAEDRDPTERHALVEEPVGCVIRGCDAPQQYRVEGPNGTRRVCRKCMEELTGLFKWRLLASL